MRHRLHLTALLGVLALAPAQLAVAQEGMGNSPAAPVLAPRPVHNSLPDLGSTANATLSRAEEYQVGRAMVRDLRTHNALLEDAETNDYLQSLGARIGVEAQQGEQRLTFLALRDRSVNAAALPGGYILMNSGLILLTETEAELAGVVAHEVGHVVQRHIARAVEAQGRIGLTALAGLLGAVLVGATTGSADAVPGLIAMGQGAAMQQQINFTRMEEHEADRVGIGYLAAAGFDPNGMATFFAKMMRERGMAGADIPSLLLTHPVDTVRLSEARARITGMAPVQRRPESESYRFVRERVRVLTGNLADLRRQYERQRAARPGDDALAYGAALVELQADNAAAALPLLKPVVARQPHLPLLRAALGQAQIAAGLQPAGIATFEQALALTPRNVPLTVRYAEALMATGQAKKAHQVLLDLFNNVAPSPEQIRLIANAANAAGDTGDAYSYMAEFHLAHGDLNLASMQLDLALATSGLTEVQRKRFHARQDEIRDALSDRPRRAARSGDDDEGRDRGRSPRAP